MIRSRLVFLTMTIAFVLSASSRLTPQEKPAKAAQPKLAIEVDDGRSRKIQSPVFAPPSGGGGLDMGTTKPLPEWKHTKGESPLTRIRIQTTLEGDAVRIKVAGVFDDSEPADAPGPKYGPVERALGSYLAYEGETVKVAELRAFGFEPLVLKVVPIVREVEVPPAPIPPQVTNNLKSVAVIGLLPIGELSNTYRLTVRNISNKTIVALDVYVPQENGRQGITSQGDAAHPVMKPGAMSEQLLSESRGGRMTDHGFVYDKPSHRVIVGTVVFDDQTYEGEPETAAGIIGQQVGRNLQFERVVPLLQNTLEYADQESTAMLERLRTEVSQMRIDVDAQVLDELLARFPELPKSYDRKSLAAVVMRGLKDGRQAVLSRIKEIEDAPRDQSSLNLVRQRLNSLKKELESGLSAIKLASSPRS